MEKAAIGIIASPLVAITIAFIAMYFICLLQKVFKLHDNHPTFKGLQLVSLRPCRSDTAQTTPRKRPV